MKGGDSKKARSQNEGLDYCGLAEIEAGDVRDGEWGWGGLLLKVPTTKFTLLSSFVSLAKLFHSVL
jgi:hypothetical protein